MRVDISRKECSQKIPSSEATLITALKKLGYNPAIILSVNTIYERRKNKSTIINHIFTLKISVYMCMCVDLRGGYGATDERRDRGGKEVFDGIKNVMRYELAKGRLCR